METLVVAHHRNSHHQYYGRSRGYWSSKDGYSSSPPANLRAINCRSFESGGGLLPNPFPNSTPVNRKEFRSPKTISPCLIEKRKGCASMLNSRSVPVPINIKFEKLQEVFFSERWAGPAYSNSPSPSSLPLPRFSCYPKRTSLDLPTLICKIDLEPMAKSAPTSPVINRTNSSDNGFNCFDSATRALQRILNLDIAD